MQTRAQQRCITALNKAGAVVARVVGKQLVSCVRAACKGKLAVGTTAEQCLSADPRARLAKVEAKAAAIATRFCTTPPGFGPTTAVAVNAAFRAVRRVHQVFGDDLDAAIIATATDRDGAACQVAVATGMTEIANAKLKAFNACKTAGLKSGTIDSAATLEACFGVDPRVVIARTEARAQRRAGKKCDGVALATAFPGRCAAAAPATLFDCVAPQVDCGVCLAVNGGDHLSHGCDKFQNGVATELCGTPLSTTQSVARQWDEEALAAIRIDLPRPPVHARNLFYVSVAMWDAWAAYDPTADAFLDKESPASSDIEHDRAIAISFAAYRVLSHLYALSVNAATTQTHLDARMLALGLDKTFTTTTSDLPAAVGNRIAAAVIAYGLADGANEANNYADPTYTPVNDPLIVKLPGNDPTLPGTVMNDPNRWQPLALDLQITQNGIPLPDKVQVYVGAQWNAVKPFALARSDPNALYIDPGPPPHLGDTEFRNGPMQLLQFSQELDPTDPTTLDISPGYWGNNPLGTNDGTGYATNPITNQPYAPQSVKRADFARVLAEFWADGPQSETPPGHWNVLANGVADNPATVKRIGGVGPVVNDLEWDVKTYLALNGAVHDAAVSCWGAKRMYDSVRPISQIRYMGGRGQSSDSLGPSYDVDGLPLVPGLVEVITAASSMPGERHAALAAFIGEIALNVWPGAPGDPTTQFSPSTWIRAKNWVPYQRDTFVTPAFASYFSGHSTFSRAAAEVLAHLTAAPTSPAGWASSSRPRTPSSNSSLGRRPTCVSSGRRTTTRRTRQDSRACTAASIHASTTSPDGPSARRSASAPGTLPRRTSTAPPFRSRRFSATGARRMAASRSRRPCRGHYPPLTRRSVRPCARDRAPSRRRRA
ncbi:MAG: hypothetical protein HY271_17260 [Deltaproteobacteria bacterium]|nr:hypothetical protein [Deltaproteobacteria bacterium]